jgi:hypothetical protein
MAARMINIIRRFTGGVKLTTHLHLVLRSSMCGAMPLWYGAHLKHRDYFTFTFYLQVCSLSDIFKTQLPSFEHMEEKFIIKATMFITCGTALSVLLKVCCVNYSCKKEAFVGDVLLICTEQEDCVKF